MPVDVNIEPVSEGVRTVEGALALAVCGDVEGGMRSLHPLIRGGWGSVYSLAGMLAEVAAFAELRQGPTGDYQAPPLASPFAAAFLAAWANRDFDGAEQALKTVYRGTGHHLTAGIRELFALAVKTADQVTAENRWNRLFPSTTSETS